MKLLWVLVGCLFSSLYAEEWNSFAAMPPMNVCYHPVSTISKEAQEHFNEGLVNFYAYTFRPALIAFKRAAEADPNLAMAYWGMARSRLKMPFATKKECDEVSEWILKAKTLSEKATLCEQNYIKALVLRCPSDPNVDMQKLKVAYKDEMHALYSNYPEDLDAATLYVDSIMEVHNSYWTGSGEAVDGTLESLDILTKVLKCNPDHVGANHFFIHCLDESKHPQRALPSAHLFEVIKRAPPHLLHMPSHIYILLGDYQKSVEANLRAIAYDKEFKERYDMKEVFPIHFYLFLIRSYMWQECYEKAYQAASTTSEHDIFPYLQMLLYFQKWDLLLKVVEPKNVDQSTLCFWRFARSFAFACQNHLEEALKEREFFLKEKKGMESDSVLTIAAELLEAQIAKIKGDSSSIEKHLLLAIEEADKLHFNEPPNWYYPIRQTLGAYYFQEGRFALAEEAFRNALQELPRNGRSLFGLWNSLRAQNKTDALYWVEREIKEALRYSDRPLDMRNL